MNHWNNIKVRSEILVVRTGIFFDSQPLTQGVNRYPLNSGGYRMSGEVLGVDSTTYLGYEMRSSNLSQCCRTYLMRWGWTQRPFRIILANFGECHVLRGQKHRNASTDKLLLEGFPAIIARCLATVPMTPPFIAIHQNICWNSHCGQWFMGDIWCKPSWIHDKCADKWHILQGSCFHSGGWGHGGLGKDDNAGISGQTKGHDWLSGCFPLACRSIGDKSVSLWNFTDVWLPTLHHPHSMISLQHFPECTSSIFFHWPRGVKVWQECVCWESSSTSPNVRLPCMRRPWRMKTDQLSYEYTTLRHARLIVEHLACCVIQANPLGRVLRGPSLPEPSPVSTWGVMQ